MYLQCHHNPMMLACDMGKVSCTTSNPYTFFCTSNFPSASPSMMNAKGESIVKYNTFF